MRAGPEIDRPNLHKDCARAVGVKIEGADFTFARGGAHVRTSNGAKRSAEAEACSTDN